MNILLSAYACEPNKGSEPGVGWSWALELSKKHNVWVITRDNNETTISAYLKQNPEYHNENLKFIYVGLSPRLTFWKKGRRGIRLFYMMWQWKAARVAREWHSKVRFDLVQHITFVSFTQPTYMYKLGIPMIWGPVSGGENIPSSVKIKMSKKEKVVEASRKLSQYTALIMPSIRKTMKHSKAILTATEETRNMMPLKYAKKTAVLPAIGLDQIVDTRIVDFSKSSKVKIVMAGRLINWKAFDIGLSAFLAIADKNQNVELHILGEGNKKHQLEKIAGDYLNKQVYFDAPVEHDQIYKYYKGFDIFLNTTLRDSGCMTMMEAMSVGLPCLAIAAGGPKILLQDFPSCQIPPTSYEECVKKTAQKLEQFITDRQLRKEVGKLQQEYARENFLMENKVKLIQRLYI